MSVVNSLFRRIVLLGSLVIAHQALALTVTLSDVNPSSSTLHTTDADGASGGRINHLASVAGNNQIFYAASEWGGIFETTDGGQTWSRLNGHLPVATWDVKVDPVNTNTVYATSLYDGRMAPISGIEVSYDAGMTWTHPATAHPNPALEGTPNDNTPDPGFSCSTFGRTEPSAFGIGIRPDAPQNVFIGTNCGIAISNNSGATWRFVDPTPATPADNVWDVVVQGGGPSGQGIVDICTDDGHLRSTDGGNTWVLGSGLPTGPCSLAVSPDESYVLLAAASDGFIYESDNGGTSWTNLGSPDSRLQGRVSFVATNQRSSLPGPVDRFDLWFGDVSLFSTTCTSQAAPGGAPRCPATYIGFCNGLCDDGVTGCSGNGNCTGIGSGTCNGLGVTPCAANANCTGVGTGVCLIGARPMPYAVPAGWTGPFTRSSGAHDDVGDIAFDTMVTVDACPMVFSSDGGVYRNTNLGAGCQTPAWQQPTVTPHALWVFGMDGADQTGVVNEDLYMGCQDDGTFATTNAGAATPTWFNRDCCDSFDMVADSTRVFSSTCCVLSGSSVIPSFRISGAGMVGTTNIATNPPGSIPLFRFPDFMARFGANQYAAATSSGVSITSDITVSPIVWTQLGTASTPAGGFCTVHASVSGGTPTFYGQTFCGDTAGSGQLWRYVGTNPSGTWQRVDNTDGLQGGFGVVGVAFSDPNLIYASNLSPFGPQIVFSTDGGTTWDNDPKLDGLMTGKGVFKYRTLGGPTAFSASNGYAQPSVLAFDPGNSAVVVAGGCDSGVFLSMNGGHNWVLLTDPFNSGTSGIPHLPRPRFAYFDHESTDLPGQSNFYVGTQGRGIWRVAVVNKPPVCNADGPYVAECAVPSTLDGSGSSDPDGDPLTFSWNGPFSGGTATGAMPSVQFPNTGTFNVGLDVSDGPTNATCSTSVTVKDTLPPVIPPNPPPAECTSPAGTFVDIGKPTDLCDPNPSFTNNAPPLFLLGSTPVMWTATDKSGNTATGTQIVKVVDTTAPTLTLSVSPTILWPPNHRLVNIHAAITVSDICDPAPKVRLASITSSEPDSGTGAHDVPNDIQGAAFGTDDRTFRLRAEHSPGGVRTYTITYVAEDKSGNTTTAQATVRVPKSGATLISRDGEPANGASTAVAINTNGNFVAFSSDATNLVSGDTNQTRDVFVRDRTSHSHETTERVSVRGVNEQANGASAAPAISGNGQFVAFSSLATNLILNDGNGQSDVFVRDRVARITERVSVAGVNTEANGASSAPSINGDGQFVAFQSQASNLVIGDTNGVADIFVRDRLNQSTERLCNTVQGDGPSSAPAISRDGNFVAFASAATNLVLGDTNRRIDIFVCDRHTGALERVSVSSGGEQGDGDSILPAISEHGRFVAFKSLADNLVPGDHNGFVDVFVRDRVAGTTERISVNSNGGDSNDVSFPPSISDDGRFVAFGSFATNLVGDDTNGTSDVFVRDRQTAITFLVDVNDEGEEANQGTPDIAPAITGDGVQVGFVSLASNLAGSDNELNDVFVVCNPALPTPPSPLVAPDRLLRSRQLPRDRTAQTPLRSRPSGRRARRVPTQP